MLKTLRVKGVDISFSHRRSQNKRLLSSTVTDLIPKNFFLNDLLYPRELFVDSSDVLVQTLKSQSLLWFLVCGFNLFTLLGTVESTGPDLQGRRGPRVE